MSAESAVKARLTEACASLEVPGVVSVANAGETFRYAEAFGVSSLKQGETQDALKLDSTFYLASATKLLTAISALQCVERGQLNLDEDVTHWLPELGDLEILTGFDDKGKSILVKAVNKITLRHLLTHTSGLAYEFLNPLLQQWRQLTGIPLPSKKLPVVEFFNVPLLFEPGSSYVYSTGYDFAGVMVARANSMTLNAYMEKHIFQPLGLRNLTLDLDSQPDMLARQVDLSMRTGGTHPVFRTAIDSSAPLTYIPRMNLGDSLEDASGGGGGSGSLLDYSKILKSLAADDGKLLASEMLDELFRPQLKDAALAKFKEFLSIKEMNNIMAGMGVGVDANHALGGAIVLEDIPGGRRKGTMTWTGLPNIYWWVDRVAGISGVFGTQILPFGDEKCIELFREFENFVYAAGKR
ncbi:Acyltransferase LovD [Lachnellula arida]|uniref:Acyltransferase LovD n=1 Tax=Lachnellula arida TaxID=1316785 RepID=A0A8T9B823_9HELO|nr:Acyltransferase LovD [Lachnellula arida]